MGCGPPAADRSLLCAGPMLHKCHCWQVGQVGHGSSTSNLEALGLVDITPSYPGRDAVGAGLNVWGAGSTLCPGTLFYYVDAATPHPPAPLRAQLPLPLFRCLLLLSASSSYQTGYLSASSASSCCCCGRGDRLRRRRPLAKGGHAPVHSLGKV